MRRSLVLAMALAACGGDDGPSTDARTLIDCIRSAEPNVVECTSAFFTVNAQAEGATADAMVAYNDCQTAEATGPTTAPGCEDEADALVAALGG